MSSLKSVAFSCLAFTISSVSYAAGLSGLIPSIPPAPLPSPVGAPPFLVAAPLPAPAPSPITITTLRIAGVGDSANLNQVVKDQGKDTYLFYPVLQTAIWYAVDLGSPQEEVTLKFKLPSYLKIGTPTGFLLSGFTLVSYTSDAGGTVFEMKGTPTDPSVSGRLRATVDATAPADQRGVVSLTVTAKSGRTTALDVPAKVFEDLRFYVGGATVSNHGFAPLDFDPDDTNRVPVGVLNYRLAKTPDTMRQALYWGLTSMTFGWPTTKMMDLSKVPVSLSVDELGFGDIDGSIETAQITLGFPNGHTVNSTIDLTVDTRRADFTLPVTIDLNANDPDDAVGRCVYHGSGVLSLSARFYDSPAPATIGGGHEMRFFWSIRPTDTSQFQSPEDGQAIVEQQIGFGFWLPTPEQCKFRDFGITTNPFVWSLPTGVPSFFIKRP